MWVCLFWQYVERIKNLLCYVCPAVGGLCVTFLYNIVDGIFVGQGVGATALGAVNISVPFVTAAMALAAMLPMGGATIIAVCTGKDDKEGANQAFMSALVMTIVISLLLTVIGMAFARDIVMVCGGKNLSREMVDMAVQYLFFYMAFCFPMLMAPCLSVFVRNDGAPGLMIFNSEPELIASGSKALPVFAVSFIPMAVNLIIAGYFFSVQRTFQANLISMSRGVVLKAIAIFAVPMLFGQSVIWLSPFVAEIVTAGMAGVIWLLECRKNQIANKV